MYIKLFESLFSRDDTDKVFHSDWKGGKLFESMAEEKITDYIKEIETYLDNIKDDFKMFELQPHAPKWIIKIREKENSNYQKSELLQTHAKHFYEGLEGFYGITKSNGIIYVFLGFNSYFYNRNQTKVEEYIEEFDSRISESFKFEKINLGEVNSHEVNSQFTLQYKIIYSK